MLKDPPFFLQQWLDYPVSISDRLKNKSGKIRLEVLTHSWSYPLDIWDHIILQSTTLFFRREIIMWANQHACWYARTLIPQTTYEIHKKFFNDLDTKPLGELIWNNSAIQRTQMQQFCIEENQPEHLIFKKMGYNAPILWGRCSTFGIQSTTNPLNFFLLEIFLPDIKHYE